MTVVKQLGWLVCVLFAKSRNLSIDSGFRVQYVASELPFCAPCVIRNLRGGGKKGSRSPVDRGLLGNHYAIGYDNRNNAVIARCAPESRADRAAIDGLTSGPEARGWKQNYRNEGGTRCINRAGEAESGHN